MVEFLLGALAWHGIKRLASWRARAAMLLGGALLLGLAVTMFLVPLEGPLASSPVWQLLQREVGLLAAIAYAALLTAIKTGSNRLAPWLGRIGRWLGSLSYSVYLFHNAVLVVVLPWMADAPQQLILWTCVGVTLVVAQSLHTLVEAPIRAWGRTLAPNGSSATESRSDPASAGNRDKKTPQVTG